LAASRPTDSDAKLRFAMLPSSREAYRFATKTWEPRGEGDVPHVAIRSISGRMAAVSASSSDARRAQGFVVWLAGRAVSPRVSQHSAAPPLFRQPQIAPAGGWTASLSPDAGRQYAEVLSHTL